jgi:hypothetical protein
MSSTILSSDIDMFSARSVRDADTEHGHAG